MAMHEEQRALARVSWQLVGLADALAEPNSWLRRTVFGTDVFVQNFGGELRGYHNVCAHRGFPIRREDAGNGPVQCGFHGWVYSKDGVPTGVPRNAELFQLSRDAQRDLALPAVRVEKLGRFVFATTSSEAPPLAEFLGPYADCWRTIGDAMGPLFHLESAVTKANWKRHVEITMDDYHLAHVHPTTFGAFAGDAEVHRFFYQRHGMHSCYMRRRDPDWTFETFWDGIKRGVNDPTGYKIFNTFPSSIIAASADSIVVWVAYALTPTSTRVDQYLFGWAHNTFDAATVQGLVDFNTKVFHEDRRACEEWQTAVGALDHPPVLGKLEQRIAWFQDAYADVIRRAAAE
jgi:choline monooxygenase